MASPAKDIQNHNIAPVYLFFGEEAFKRRYYKNLLKEALGGGPGMDINYTAFEGKNIDWQAVYDATQTLPFFAQKRLVVVENSGKFQTGAGSAEPTGFLERTIEELPPTTCLAFFEEHAAKNRKIFKTISARGVAFECGPDKADAVIGWLARGFDREGKKFRRSTLELMIRRVGMDYDKLRMESEKIFAYVGDREVVEDADVLAVTCETVESRVFDMTKAICEKNIRLVMDRYQDLLLNREPPLRILGALRSEIRSALQVAELSAQGLRTNEITNQTGRPWYAVEDILKRLRNFSPGQLADMLDAIAEMDRMIKSGDIEDKTGLEMLLVQFSS